MKKILLGLTCISLIAMVVIVTMNADITGNPYTTISYNIKSFLQGLLGVY